jgi:hypothetical protein
MTKCWSISSYIRKPFLYDFATQPFWIFLHMRKIKFYFLSVWVIICLSFQNPVRATLPLMWTYPKVGSPSCYRSRHRSCMETWVNMDWCSAHRLHPWNRKSESVRTLPIPFCTKEKKLFWNGKEFSEMWKCTNVKSCIKKLFFLTNDFVLASFEKIPLLFTNVQW